MYKKSKNYLFFNLIPLTVFSSFIGFFLTLFLIFQTLYFLFTSGVYAKFAFFSLTGAIVFSISFFMYRKKYFGVLKIPSYKSFLIARNTLIKWMLMSINFYLLLCWFLLIMAGTFSGFGMYYPNAPHISVWGENLMVVKVAGIILWCVHIFLTIIFVCFRKYLFNLIILAQQKLNIGRKNIEEARDEAKVVFS